MHLKSALIFINKAVKVRQLLTGCLKSFGRIEFATTQAKSAYAD
jgi:hypothetical protein